MSKSKRVFIFIAVVFFIILAFIAYDMARKTTFPGKKPPPSEIDN